MLVLLSPSKSQDFSKTDYTKEFSEAEFINEAVTLINHLKTFSIENLMSLMEISKSIAELNFNRYREFKLPFNLTNAKQAILSFTGDVYTDIEIDKYSKIEFDFAQQHIRILSGLYGLLKPLDLIQAYRLEMGIKLAGPWGKDLYKFWGNKITEEINKHVGSLLINLASNEYFCAINTKLIKGEIITPIFKEYKNGNYQVIAIFAKRARGLMANFIIKNKLTEIDQLKDFAENNYKFDPKLSSTTELVFTRKKI